MDERERKKFLAERAKRKEELDRLVNPYKKRDEEKARQSVEPTSSSEVFKAWGKRRMKKCCTPRVRIAWRMAHLLLDIGTDAFFIYQDVFGDAFFKSDFPYKLPVIIACFVLLFYNCVFDIFQVQWLLGAEAFSDKCKKDFELQNSVVEHDQVSSFGKAKERDEHAIAFDKRQQRKVKFTKNPFLKAMELAFTIMTILCDDLPAIVLTYYVAWASGTMDSALGPASLANVAYSVVSSFINLVTAIKALLKLLAAKTGTSLKIQRLHRGVSKIERVKSEVDPCQATKWAIKMLVPTFAVYFVALWPFSLSFFSPKKLMPYIKWHQKKLCSLLHKKDGVDHEEIAAANTKTLEEAVAGVKAVMLLRMPWRSVPGACQRSCCCCCCKKQKIKKQVTSKVASMWAEPSSKQATSSKSANKKMQQKLNAYAPSSSANTKMQQAAKKITISRSLQRDSKRGPGSKKSPAKAWTGNLKA